MLKSQNPVRNYVGRYFFCLDSQLDSNFYKVLLPWSHGNNILYDIGKEWDVSEDNLKKFLIQRKGMILRRKRAKENSRISLKHKEEEVWEAVSRKKAFPIMQLSL